REIMFTRKSRRQNQRTTRPRQLFRPALERLEARLAPAVLPPAGLVSWYRAEGNANDFADSNHGTLMNGATFAAGEVGQAFSLNGTDAFVQVPDSANLDITGAITLDAWIKPTTVSGMEEIISKYDSTIDETSWAFLFNDGTFRVEFLQNGNGFPSRVVDTSTAVLNAGVFSHVAATFDTATQAIHIYVNGVDVPTTLQIG